ncbi:MAG: hypothetical protein M3N41_01765, partial [Acidobacteriota bacterium]|nr:hypothetical protein [Acidobacteriota bacterium]
MNKNLLALLLLAASAFAQKAAYTPPRTPDGQPDLGGVWNNGTITPLERPADLAGKPFFTKEEAAAYERKTAQQSNRDRRDGPADADVNRAYNEAWWDRGSQVVPSLRTSLLVDPPSGRLPALTPAAQEAARRRAEALQRPANGPEDRLIRERCIVGDNVGPPMMPSAYNNNFQIFQSANYVAILSEMMHDVRIIPLDGRAHLASDLRSWLGDSRGRWDHNTLIVETTNFNGKISFHGSDENLRVVERFTRTAPDLILYEFRIEDPTAFTAPWSAEVPLRSTKGPIYEYACHEGNY